MSPTPIRRRNSSCAVGLELLLTRQVAAEPQTWQALVHPGRKIGVGEVITIAQGEARLQAEVIARGAFGERTVRFRAG